MDDAVQDLPTRDCRPCRGRGFRALDGVREVCVTCDGLGRICANCYQAIWQCGCPGRQHALEFDEAEEDEEGEEDEDDFAGCR